MKDEIPLWSASVIPMDFLSEAQSVRADKLAAPNINVNL